MGKFVLGVALAALLGGTYYLTGFNPTLSITELHERAVDLDGEVVTVKGIVLQNAAILGTGGFVLSDGASDILVLSDSGVPRLSSEIEVTGTFRSALVINEFGYGVIYRQEGSRWGG